jgi:HEAT repeat protein
MRLKVPRLRLRTLTILIAVLAVVLWAGLSIWSPTRRLGRLLTPDQPDFVRREAAASLGHGIPPWEVDQAVSLMIRSLDDPSPRVREGAAAGLYGLGPRAERAIPRLIVLLGDEDRRVRACAARVLSQVVGSSSARRDEIVAALARALDDEDPDVRLSAAESLIELGEAQRTAGVLLAEYRGTIPYFRESARHIIRRANNPAPFVAALAPEIRAGDRRRRDEAIQTLMQIVPPEAVRSLLTSAMAADDPEVREWAAGRLQQIYPGP